MEEVKEKFIPEEKYKEKKNNDIRFAVGVLLVEKDEKRGGTEEYIEWNGHTTHRGI